MRKNIQRILFALCFSAHPLLVNAASFLDRFIDPEDGMFDTCEWLLTHRSFLPVPIIITEPAVGNGIGLGLAFFHENKASQAQDLSSQSVSMDASTPELISQKDPRNGCSISPSVAPGRDER